MQKSALAQAGARPTPEVHRHSMSIGAGSVTRRRILVVDEVVTKGTTLLAAASLVKALDPQAEVFAFGLVRTMGLVPEVDSIIAPCVGTIRLGTDGEAKRAL